MDYARLRTLVDEMIDRGRAIQAMIAEVADVERPEQILRLDVPDTLEAQRVIGEACAIAQEEPVTVYLAPGHYAGTLTLPRHGGKRIRIWADPLTLPARGERIRPGRALPVLGTPGGTTPLRVWGDDYELRGLEVLAPAVGATHIEVGSDQEPDPEKLPARLAFEQLIIRGDERLGGHRGIAMNGREIRVSESWIDRIAEIGRDAQAVCTWNSPGPLWIENNYLEASGENFMLGGARAAIGAPPADVAFLRNYVRKDPTWRTWAKPPSVKNLFELKFARRVRIAGNVFEFNWAHGQAGWAIVITTKSNLNAPAPYAVIEDVEFSGNVVRHTSSGINISGEDGPCRRLRFIDNAWDTLDRGLYGGDGRFVQIGTSNVEDVEIAHNTVLGMSGTMFMTLYGSGKMRGLRMTHNVFPEAAYGIHSSYGTAKAALDALVEAYTFTDNAIVDDLKRKLAWPAGNHLLPVGFDLRAAFDAAYRLVEGTPLAPLASGFAPTSDGRAVGADPDKLREALALVL